MHKWLQKEFFFMGMLCLIFLLTASVAAYVKNHLHMSVGNSQTAFVIWPESQAAIYPEAPVPTPTATEAPKPSPTPDVKPRNTYRRAVHRTYRRATRAAQRYRSSFGSQRRAVTKKTVKTVKKTKPAAPVKTALAKNRAQQEYEAHMQWVRKTLKSYRDKRGAPATTNP